MRRLLIVVVVLVLVGCAGPTSVPTPTSRPADTARPASTPLPTDTPRPSPTDTPRSTPTHRPTDTAEPTVTPLPSDTPTPATVGAATVVRVIDGDTIDVSIGGVVYPVRYIGMDTPEKGQPGHAEAKAINEKLVAGKTVQLVKDVSERDRYDRLLRYVYVGELFVNAELVKRGYAQPATYPPDVRHADEFVRWAQEAREAELGLWAPEPTPAVPAGAGEVRIVRIYYDGQKGRAEPDEYAEIKNVGDAPVSIAGWRLNADDAGQDFWFPDVVLQPGQAVRVYTNEVHPESGGFTFGRGSAIWTNKGECGHLYDASGAEVSTYCY